MFLHPMPTMSNRWPALRRQRSQVRILPGALFRGGTRRFPWGNPWFPHEPPPSAPLVARPDRRVASLAGSSSCTAVHSPGALVPVRSGCGPPPDAGRGGAGARGLLPATRVRRLRQPASHAAPARGRLLRGHGRGGLRARLRRPEELHARGREARLRRLPVRARDRHARRRDRGRHARQAPHRRGERGRREAPRARGRDEPRRDRLRLAGARARSRRSAPPCRRSSASSPTAARPRGSPPSASAPARSPRRGRATPAGRTSSSRRRRRRTPSCAESGCSEGALVCAIGANDPRARELDNVVLERAAFVCCDSREQSRLESGDLIEPVAGGVLDWLEVHELQEVVAGAVQGRRLRPRRRRLQVERARGVGRRDRRRGARARARARRRARALGALAGGDAGAGGLDHVPADGVDDLGPVEQAEPAAASLRRFVM